MLDKLKSVSAEKAQTQEELKNDDLSDKKKEELQKKINNLDARAEILQGSISDIITLGADQDRVFDLISSSGETNHVKLGSDGVINVQGANDALHVHEIKHVSLSLSSKAGMQFSSDGFLLATTRSGLKDEITAYRTQYGYDPSLLPRSVKSSRGINLKYIGNLRKSDGTPVYPMIHQRWLNYKKQVWINKKFQKQNQQK